MDDARTNGQTRDCRGCRYWSEMIAMSGPETGGKLKALCLNFQSQKYSEYMAARESCPKWKSGHLGAIDEPGSSGREYDDEPDELPEGLSSGRRRCT